MILKPESVESRREGNLLARLLGALIVSGALSAVIQLVVLPDFLTTFLILMGAITLLGIALIMSLRGRHKNGAILTVLITSAASFGAIFSANAPQVSISFLVLPVLLCSLFFRPVFAGLTALILSVGVAMLPLMAGARFSFETITAPAAFLVIASALVALASRHRAAMEKLRREDLQNQAMHDTLTGLWNRRAFEAKLSESVRSARTEGLEHALLYLDLDRFKLVNDACGHSAGDELLRQLGRLFLKTVGPPHMFARIGGDEFAVLMHATPVARAIEVAQDITNIITNFRFIHENRSFDLRVSVGVTEINRDSGSDNDILVAADQACYAAKSAGTQRIRVIGSHDARVEEYQREVINIGETVRAMKEGRFLLYGQVICSTETRVPAFTEVLVRMLATDGRVVEPAEFLLGLERFRWMPVLDRWVLEQSLRCLRDARTGGVDNNPLPVISVNLSGQSLSDETLLPFLLKLMESMSVNPQAVCFEITETSAIASLTAAVKFMRELRKIGCRFALDDFGSGLSSFSYLKQLPIDYIKIAGPLVQGVQNDHVARATLAAIAGIARSMQLPTVAEWVENDEAMTVVREIGIEYVQGYFTGRPAPLSLFEH